MASSIAGRTTTGGKAPGMAGAWAYAKRDYDWPSVIASTHEACVAAHNALGATDLAMDTSDARYSAWGAKRELRAANVLAYDTWRALEDVLAQLIANWERGLL